MNTILSLKDYANEIDLFEPWSPSKEVGKTREEIVLELLRILKKEGVKFLDYKKQRRILHGLINTLPPHTYNSEEIKLLDRLLQLELSEKTLTTAEKLFNEGSQSVGTTKIVLWQGDITSLKIDAIVNAANSALLGCFQPLHLCIDNAIHSASGVQLRDDCDLIMTKQGIPEPTGMAKITRAYNLPSNFVLHTVGPIVEGAVTLKNQSHLASAYTSCLDVCREIESIRSLAFCSISTGVFGYPVDQAARLAVDTVAIWLREHPEALDLVVFNVFSDYDTKTYQEVVNSYDF